MACAPIAAALTNPSRGAPEAPLRDIAASAAFFAHLRLKTRERGADELENVRDRNDWR
jgi:hypothetical protein